MLYLIGSFPSWFQPAGLATSLTQTTSLDSSKCELVVDSEVGWVSDSLMTSLYGGLEGRQ